jgi:hypothetical protein
MVSGLANQARVLAGHWSGSEIRSVTEDASDNMLHNQRTSALLDSSPQEQGGENSGAELVNLALGFLRRQYLVIIITTALAFAASIIFLRIAPPTYTAQVKVLFGNSKAPFTQQADRGRMARRQDRVIHISGSAASWGARRVALRRPAIPTATTASPASLETN